ncbi:MAG: NeuD/PglB/VioB family sugar acetyltransferase [Deltaproteobacteria bacterium]|nr:NeuD/PglB/VioB family sugar acetyltransferase [Deltaproteobacteria bacterium]
MTIKKPKILLIGGGGHCKACIDVIEQDGRFEIAGIVERLDYRQSDNILGYPISGTDEGLPALKNKYEHALVTVGQIKTPETRIRLYERLLAIGFELPVLVSPLAYVSPHAQIGYGTIVMHHALVNAGARVGRNCIINTKALIEHDAVVEDHCHIATGGIINGETIVQSESFVGSNAICRERITVGKGAVVGGGVMVMHNIHAQSTVRP